MICFARKPGSPSDATRSVISCGVAPRSDGRVRAGVPRADALRRMEKRLDMEEIASFVGTVIQAEKMGARLGTALRVQALQRRTERFQRAEKLAMEAPVKLILPLIVFIFPVTFIVLAFPIAMKFLMEGML